MDGILLIDKPEKMNSHTVLARLRGVFGIDRIGHGGTLDPLATGLLVVLVGRAVKLSEYVIGHDKTYEVTATLGQMRDSFDADGRLVSENPAVVSREQVEAVVREFPKQYGQVPPMFCAIKIRGVPAYRHARKGRKPVMAARTVHIRHLELTDFDFPKFTFRVSVSSGTYVRSLVVDLAERLGTVAFMSGLRRVASGHFVLSQAHPVQTVVTWSPEQLERNLVSMEEIVRDFPLVEIGEDDRKAFVNGQWIKVENVTGIRPELISEGLERKRVRIRSGGKFFALGFIHDNYLKAEKVLLR